MQAHWHSRCIRTAGHRGCRSRSGKPARRCRSRCSRPWPAERGSMPLPRSARLAACLVVGDDHRVSSNITAWKRAYGHMYLAHLLAHPAGVAVGRRRRTGSRTFPICGGHRSRRPQRRQQFVDRGEVADEGEAGPQRDDAPDEELDGAASALPALIGARSSFWRAGMVVPRSSLDPHEDLGVDRLRAGVAAPQAARDRGEQEQAKRRDDQQDREKDDVLRPEDTSRRCRTCVRRSNSTAWRSFQLSQGSP